MKNFHFLFVVLIIGLSTQNSIAQLGEGWVLDTPKKEVHLADKTHPKASPSGIVYLQWAPYLSVGGDSICADYSYDAATETETFRLLDSNRTNRAEIRYFNEYRTGARQFEGYVTFYPPLNDEGLFQIWGSIFDGKYQNRTQRATQIMIRGYAEDGGSIKIANRKISSDKPLISNIYGVEVKINVIHLQEDVGNRIIIYFDDKEVLNIADDEPYQYNSPDGVYHKYGCYGTLKTKEAVVKWRKVRYYKDGNAPSGTKLTD